MNSIFRFETTGSCKRQRQQYFRKVRQSQNYLFTFTYIGVKPPINFFKVFY